MLEADLLVDRRRLKRRLNFWRVLAVLATVAAVAAAIRPGGTVPIGKHVERIAINGVITQDRKLLDAIGAMSTDGSIAAVIVAVDSPGGSVAGGETIHKALERLATAKPMVTVMGGTAASAGYMVSLPAERIFALDSTLTGSIGVILETVEISGLLAKLGIDATAITSGPLKDQPSFTRPLTAPGREYLNGLVGDMFDQFVAMVAQARHLDVATVRTLADGRAYTGRQAKALGLVDEIGGEPEARAWLAKQHDVAESLPVHEYGQRGWFARMVGSVMPALLGAQMTDAWALWIAR